MKKIDTLADYAENRIRLESEVRKDACDDGIDICGLGDRKSEIHIYSGIRTLAKEAGANLRMRRHSDNYTAYSFEYRGIEFFQLEKNCEGPK